MLRHIVYAQDFSFEFLEWLFKKTDEMVSAFNNPVNRGMLIRKHVGRSMFLVFYEPSTRTRISHDIAAQRLGMMTTGTENAGEFSSAVKGESLEDTIRVMCEYHPDIIVLRHKEIGSAEKAAKVANHYGVSIINAGDGAGQHPTQALLDLYTIKRLVGKTKNLNVVIGGDLKNGRTARSLTYLLSKYEGNKITFISPEHATMGQDILEHLNETGTLYLQCADMSNEIRDADVVYWTRTQKERGSQSGELIINRDVATIMKAGSIIMHPLPRVGELTTDVDELPQAKYFQQAGFGMFVRMALIDMLLSPNQF